MRRTIALLAVVVAAAFASSALAGNSPTATTYNTKGETIQKTVSKPGSKIKTAPKSNTRVRTGTLPFTGLDLGFIVAGGLVLVGTGVSLRRLTRRTPPTA
jgi:hypothetical protein